MSTNTNETLDGVTAGFIASIANGLSRHLDIERMKELIKDPEKMKLLLLPLIDDCYAATILPAIHSVPYRMSGITYLYNSSDIPTLRKVLKEAYERKYAPLSEESAEKLCALMMKTQEIHGHSGIFPFVRNGELWLIRNLLNPKRRSSPKIIYPDSLDISCPSIRGVPIFFRQGLDDRSDCFKC